MPRDEWEGAVKRHRKGKSEVAPYNKKQVREGRWERRGLQYAGRRSEKDNAIDLTGPA